VYKDALLFQEEELLESLLSANHLISLNEAHNEMSAIDFFCAGYFFLIDLNCYFFLQSFLLDAMSLIALGGYICAVWSFHCLRAGFHFPTHHLESEQSALSFSSIGSKNN